MAYTAPFYPPINAYSRPNIKQKVEVVIESIPNPILEAVKMRNTKLSSNSSDPWAAYKAPKAKPVNILALVPIVRKVEIQYSNSISLVNDHANTYFTFTIFYCRVVTVVFLMAANILIINGIL